MDKDINQDGFVNDQDDLTGDDKIDKKDKAKWDRKIGKGFTYDPETNTFVKPGESTSGSVDWNAVAYGTSNPAIAAPKWISGSSTDTLDYQSLLNKPQQWLANGEMGKYNRLAKMIGLPAGADITEFIIAWNNTLLSANAASTSVVTIAKNPGFKNAILKGTSFEISGPRTPTRNIQLSDRQTADDTLGQYMANWLDRAPTKAEKNDFYKKLVAAQRKAPSVTRYAGDTTITTGGGITAEQFARQYVLSKISVKNPELDGTLGDVQNAIASFATDSGITLSDKQIINMVKSYANGTTVESLKTSLNEKAQQKYAALADILKQNGNMTVKDAAADYVSEMSRMLEINPNDVKISDIEPAIAAIGQDGKERKLAIWEWRKQLRGDARYQYTAQAKQEATGMAQSFARAFGVNI